MGGGGAGDRFRDLVQPKRQLVPPRQDLLAVPAFRCERERVREFPPAISAGMFWVESERVRVFLETPLFRRFTGDEGLGGRR